MYTYTYIHTWNQNTPGPQDPDHPQVFQKGSGIDIQTQKGSGIDIQTQKGSVIDIQTQKGFVIYIQTQRGSGIDI